MFKQEAHGPHRSPEFKSINTYDYNITLIKKRKKQHYLLYNNLLFFHLKKLESPSPVPSLVKIGSVVLEEKIFKFRQCIFTIS